MPGLPARLLLSAALLAANAGSQSVVAIDIHPGSADSAPAAFVDGNGTLYFTAADGTHGRELWKSDGTAAGTVLAADIEAGANGSNPTQTVCTGKTLFCSATTAVTGTELVAVDIATDTATVIDILAGSGSSDPGTIVFYRGRAWFAATGSAGRELWSSDGTVAGTGMVADLVLGIAGSAPQFLCVYAGKLYFQATTPATGTELFVTDGTAAGTKLALDLGPGAASSSPMFLTVFRDELVFRADTAAQGAELASFDGSSVRVIDIVPGSSGSDPQTGRSQEYPPGNGDRFAATDHHLFFRGTQPATGIELYRYDGTSGALLMDLRPGSASAEPYDLTVLGDKLFFTANDGTFGFEPWETLGTAATTRLVADLRTGSASTFCENYTPIGSRRVVFEAPLSGIGREIVISDGVLTRVFDLAFGSPNSDASNLTAITGRIFCNGKIPGLGDELYVIETDAMTLPWGRGCSSGPSIPRLTGTDAIVGKPFSLRLQDARPGEISLLCIGVRSPTPALFDFGAGCYLYLDFSKRVYILPLPTDAAGQWQLNSALGSDPGIIGFDLGVMVAVPGDPGQPPFGVDLSNLLMMTIGR